MTEKRTARQVAVTKPKRQPPKRPATSSDRPSWEQRFRELESFKKTQGHCNVPAIYPPNPALGRWVANVRRAKKHGAITEERVRRLDALAFRWERKPAIAAVWEQRIHDLNSFKQEHGHCNVPDRYRPNPALAHWVANLRHRKKRGKVDEGKIRCLNTLGFCWVRQATWEQRIHDLTTFKQKYGHCNVPMRYPPKPVLGWWVSSIRQRRKRGEIAKDKIRLLNALGFCWQIRQRGLQIPWEQRVNDLKAFKMEHGHCNVPTLYPPNPTLGYWVTNLRKQKKRGTLAKERIFLLDALGFCWVRRETESSQKSMMSRET